jgi:hypothetical protein
MCAGDSKSSKGRIMICCSVAWTLWNFRNSVVFENGTGSFSELLEGVKVSSWKWWLARTKNADCLYYEWWAEPILCMSR